MKDPIDILQLRGVKVQRFWIFGKSHGFVLVLGTHGTFSGYFEAGAKDDNDRDLIICGPFFFEDS